MQPHSKTAEQTPVERLLRVITVWCWAPAMVMLIIAGVKASHAFPALGLVPQTISLVYGLIVLLKKKEYRVAHFLLDTLLTLYMIGMLIPGWIIIRHSYGWRWDTGVVMLACYGTVPLMVTFCIHAFFMFREFNRVGYIRRIFQAIFCCGGRSSTCPHCQKEFLARWQLSGSDTPHSSDSKDSSYERVPAMAEAEEAEGRPSSSGEPRPSTDDETARLV